jgi:hypothetical protein
MSTQLALESRSFRDYHETELLERLRDPADRLPADYAKSLRPLGIRIRETGEEVTYRERDRGISVATGLDSAKTAIELSLESWEQLTRDLESSAGLIYGDRVVRLEGDLMDLMQWEPALRWMFVRRPVYDATAVDLRSPSGRNLDPCHGFRLDDDPEEMKEYLRTVGYLWIRGVFSAEEVATLQAEAEELRLEAREGDQESWWGKTEEGESVVCRVLRAGTKEKMRSLRSDERLTRFAEFCDVPMKAKQAPEDKDGVTVLWKQPGVAEGLGDLPWHRDCGMGGHASMCPTAVQSIFLGPNTPEAGQIRFLPGSWQTSLAFAEGDAESAPEGVAPPAEPGDVTFHYGDGLHVAPPPTGSKGPFRSCVLIGYQREGASHHLGGRHYNDVLLGSEDGQIENMTKIAARR